MSTTAQNEIGEVVIILVNILGWLALAVILITGAVNVMMFLAPNYEAPETEVTIEVSHEQAE